MPPWSHDKSGSWWRFAASACWSRSFSSASTTEALREKKKRPREGPSKTSFRQRQTKLGYNPAKLGFLYVFHYSFTGVWPTRMRVFHQEFKAKVGMNKVWIGPWDIEPARFGQPETLWFLAGVCIFRIFGQHSITFPANVDPDVGNRPPILIRSPLK